MEYMESRMQDQIEGAQLAHEKAMKAGNEPAFPAPEASIAIYGHPDYLTGITIRDHFAIHALPTFLALSETEIWNQALGVCGAVDHSAIAAKAAYLAADAMLAARAK